MRLGITLDEYNEVISKFPPVGTKVKACVYMLRHKYGHKPGDEWRECEIVGYVSHQAIREGHRFGALVEFEGQTYWVDVKDMEAIQ